MVCAPRITPTATWGVRPTKLPDVCRFLGIPLKHHDALSDAEAAARIVIAARGGMKVPSQQRDFTSPKRFTG